MSPAEDGPAGRGAVVVWRVEEAILAVPLESTLEIAPIADDGLAVSRAGRLEPRTPPGLTPPVRPSRAVVVRAPASDSGDEGAVALAADEVEGVVQDGEVVPATPPDWLRGLPADHLAGLILLADGRIAALLAVDAMAGG